LNGTTVESIDARWSYTRNYNPCLNWIEGYGHWSETQNYAYEKRK